MKGERRRLCGICCNYGVQLRVATVEEMIAGIFGAESTVATAVRKNSKIGDFAAAGY